MLIIPTFILVSYIFFKLGEQTNIRKNKRIKTEKYQAYRMVKSYCSRLENLNKQYQLEKEKVTKANEVIRSANIQIACLKAGLNSQTSMQPFNFFDDLHSPGQIKTRYKLLSAAYHPDKGGNLHTMQVINSQYKQAFKYY